MARYGTPLPLPTVAPTTNSSTANTPPRQDTDDGKKKNLFFKFSLFLFTEKIGIMIFFFFS